MKQDRSFQMTSSCCFCTETFIDIISNCNSNSSKRATTDRMCLWSHFSRCTYSIYVLFWWRMSVLAVLLLCNSNKLRVQFSFWKWCWTQVELVPADSCHWHSGVQSLADVLQRLKNRGAAALTLKCFVILQSDKAEVFYYSKSSSFWRLLFQPLTKAKYCFFALSVQVKIPLKS